MEIGNLPKRSEIKKRIKLEIADSPPEWELNYELLKIGLRPEKQYPIGSFFVDLAFPKYKLAIEYDGKWHLENLEYDQRRDRFIRSKGWDIVRVMNKGDRFKISFNEKIIDEWLYQSGINIVKISAGLIKDIIGGYKKSDPNFMVKYSIGEVDENGDTIKRTNGFVSIASTLDKKREELKKQGVI